MVYACRHRELSGHLVAMKVLFAEVARDTVAAARFRNEIVASYGVSHPNVVRAYEYFRDGDLVAFTMEYIGGGDLADRISHDEPLPISEIERMLGQMCSGVQAIHDAGIIHRDLKPENILITTEGDIKITDFGIARHVTGPKLTEHGGVVGTIDYVSPEYLERGQVDARSDIYALGVLAFEMITGESPFKGNSVIETMTIRLRSDPPAPSSLRPECPPSLDKIVLKAMRRDPDKRYQRALEMSYDLQAAMGASASHFSSSGAFAAVRNSPAPEQTSFADGGAERSQVLPPPSSTSREPRPAPIPARQAGFGASAPLETSQATVSLSGEAISMLQRPTDRLFEGSDFYEVEPLESVLSSKTRYRTDGLVPESSESSIPNVSISRGHLSPERMKQLAVELYPEHESRAKRFMIYGLLIFLGLGLGLFALRHFEQGPFKPAPNSESNTLFHDQ